MMRKLLIGFAVLVVLVVVALAALLLLVDVDHYKPQIEQAVLDKMGRTLKIDGKLSLSVFPNIAVALPHTTLSEHGSDRQFLSLDRARVSLAVLPLLSGRVEAGTVALYGLHARVERGADGSSNLDDLTGAAKPGHGAGGASDASQPAKTGGTPAVEVGGIKLVDAELVYADQKAHNTVTVSKLNLKTGRLASRSTTPIDFSASVDATEPQSHIDLALKGTLAIDLDRKAYGVRGLDAHVRGHVAGDNLDVALTAPALQIDAEHAAGESLKLVAAVTGAHQARLELALEKLSGSLERITADSMTLQIDAEQGSQKVSAHLGSPLKIEVAAQSVELSKLAGEANLQSPTLPQKTLKVALDGSMRLEGKAQNVAAHIDAAFDETKLAARLAVQGFAGPHIGFDVDIDRINLDRYLPAAAPAAPSASKPAAGEAVAAGSGDDAKVDLSAIKPLNLAGDLKIGALQFHNLKATKLRIGVKAAGGHLQVTPLLASLYEGALNGGAKLDADANRVAANAVLEGISIQPLLKDLMGKDILEGHGNVKLDITTLGPTVGALKRALGGTASLALRDGAVRGINIAQKLRDFKSALGGGSSQTQAANASDKTEFSEFSASFDIKKGVATNNDLLAKSPLLRLGGAGTIDIGASTIDYTAQVSVVGTLAGQGGSDLSSLHGVTVPIHLSGPYSALSYRLDWGSVAGQALKNKATDRIKELLGNKVKQGGSSSDGNLGNALKGLLGK